MSNEDVVLDIKNQEHVPTLTPADQSRSQTSSDDESPIQELVLTDEEYQISEDQSLISTLQREIEQSSEQRNSSQQIPKIQRIPEIMFQQKKFRKNYYRVWAMTIAPIYTGEELGKELKLKLAAQFIRNSGVTSNRLLVKIKNEEEALLRCFDDSCGFPPVASTLLLDGCSILQFIYSRVWDKLKELQINNGKASLIEQDLFLMENQIPFRVLEILMDQLPYNGSFSKTVIQQSIDIFIRMNLMTPENYLKGSYLDFYKEIRPVHLLDILRSGLLYAFDLTNRGSSIDSSYRDPSSNNEHKREYFRNIQELKAAGIKLESSGISCLGDVTFTSSGWFRARLKIPPLIVNDSTGRKLWNLVAYEMCPENCNSDYGVTSYVSLLDSLIDSKEDVKELRSARILRNHLSSDNEVAKLFNEIGFNTVSDQAYRDVKQKIQMHFDS